MSSPLKNLHPTALTPQEADAILLEVFPELGAEVIKLWPYFKTYCAREDTPIFRAGETGDYMLITVEGMVKVLGGDAAQAEALALLGRGETIGEMSLVDEAPRSATCVALEETVFAVLTRDELKRMGAEQPQLAMSLITHVARTLSQRLRRASEALQTPVDLFQHYA